MPAFDVFSIGRHSARVHEALLQFAAARDLFYMYDTIPAALLQPSSATQHRDLLANCAKRSRFFVAYEAQGGFLWRSDGTPAGTVKLQGPFTVAGPLHAVGDVLFFSAV